MTRAPSPLALCAATTAGEQPFAKKSVSEFVLRWARGRWGEDRLAVELGTRAGMTPRASQYWAARDRGLSAQALGRLILSDIGPELLFDMIAEFRAEASAWEAFRFARELSELRRRQDDTRRRLETLERSTR